jgi:DNA-binding NtrC family response regulator
MLLYWVFCQPRVVVDQTCVFLQTHPRTAYELSRSQVATPLTIVALFWLLLSGEGLEDFSRRVRGSVINAVKNRMNGNISRTAQRLRIDRSSLRKMTQRINTDAQAKVEGGNELAA